MNGFCDEFLKIEQMAGAEARPTGTKYISAGAAVPGRGQLFAYKKPCEEVQA
jgi:hypothetical protein